MAGTAVALVALLPWAPSGCAGANDHATALAVDATTSAPAPTSCQPGNWVCTASEMCCSGFCFNGRCADQRPPVSGPRCPASPPRAGDFCVFDGIQLPDGVACEYGNSTVLSCDEVYKCKGSRWQVAAPDLSDPACAPNADSCPPSGPPILGDLCGLPNEHCDYLGARCECAPNAQVPGWPTRWKCATAGYLAFAGVITGGACPLPRPRLGTVCHDFVRDCDYGACQVRGGNRQACVPAGQAAGSAVGIWIDQPVECSCPETQPDAGDPCYWNGPQCEYGSSPLAQCNTLATCSYAAFGPGSLGQWSLSVPEAGPPCSPAPASQCPAAEPVAGAPCATPLLDCDYGETRCECATGPSLQSTAATWRCTDPQLAGPDCGARGHLGSPCPGNAPSCNYAACEIVGGTVEFCANGVWVQTMPPCVSCPPSPPEAGAPCAPIICEYGSSNVYDCDTIAVCWLVTVPPAMPGPSWAWIVSNPDAGGVSCQTPPQGACPASFDAVSRDAGCAGAPSFCDYAQGRCRCKAEPGAPGPTWSCQDPAPSCPRPRARLGSDCWQNGLKCAYDPCGASDGIEQICANGVWTRLPVDCDAGLNDGGSE
jgi:hypothetical protein